MTNFNSHNRQIIVIIPTENPSQDIFELVVNLLDWYANSKIIVVNYGNQNTETQQKLEGLAKITSRLHPLRQSPQNQGIITYALNYLKTLALNPEFTLILNQTEKANQEIINSLVSQLEKNRQLGAVFKGSKHKPQVIAFRHAALANSQKSVFNHQMESSLYLDLISCSGWPFRVLSSRHRFWQKKISRSIKNIISFFLKKNIYLRQAYSFSFAPVFKKSLLAAAILILIAFGTWQLKFLACALTDLAPAIWQNLSFIRYENTPAEAQTSPTASSEQTESSLPSDPCRVSNSDVVQGEMPQKIVIPALNLDLKVVSVPMTNGTWEVNDHVANFAQGTSLPNGVGGNTGIYGHDRPQVFAPIKKLKTGDQIEILTQNSRFIYHVENSYRVTPDRIDIFYSTPQPVLTLLTCDGLFSKQRYAVKANLMKIEKRYCQL
ncbi:hypothetical protein B5M47_03080 [candidate division CPR3 bacterium 4484_211]|uniref:Sortase n=1 Tax=candidate division CPR3 bacterium 4484_211 TaxID=1968527 RepID=A0A1W9NXL2_UNCC3|nr:MAG: hypothetical protein B5M47_03080 [candidate division CPR3 bacterium 4484_211]